MRQSEVRWEGLLPSIHSIQTTRTSAKTSHREMCLGFRSNQWNSASGIQPVEFSQWNSVSGIQSVEFSQWNSVSGIQPVDFSQWNSVSGIQSVVCSQWNSVSGIEERKWWSFPDSFVGKGSSVHENFVNRQVTDIPIPLWEEEEGFCPRIFFNWTKGGKMGKELKKRKIFSDSHFWPQTDAWFQSGKGIFFYLMVKNLTSAIFRH